MVSPLTKFFLLIGSSFSFRLYLFSLINLYFSYLDLRLCVDILFRTFLGILLLYTPWFTALPVAFGSSCLGSKLQYLNLTNVGSKGGCENTKPKTSFVEPQGTTTPNHFSSKPFARHTNTNQPRRMAVFQSLSICYF